jgi:hypothetical protein
MNTILEANQDVKNQSSPKGYKKPFTYPLKKRSSEILKDTSYQNNTLFPHPSVLLQVHHIFYSFLILFKQDLKVICCLEFHQMLSGLTWTSFSANGIMHLFFCFHLCFNTRFCLGSFEGCCSWVFPSVFWVCLYFGFKVLGVFSWILGGVFFL